jgi:outer membrane protein assembly factor BamE
MFRFIITATLLTILSACSMQVYKLNIQQGNIVTQDMLDKLKPGMNTTQVAYVMGNPVINDTFTTGQWDYVYRTERREDAVSGYHIRINFDKNDNYTHYEGALPSSTKPVLQTKKDQPVKAFEKN